MKLLSPALLLTVLLIFTPQTAKGEFKVSAPLGLPPVPVPENNPITKEKVALGEKLYNDTRLSKDGTVGCVTCHSPKKGFADGKRVSEGVGKQTGARNAPTSANAAYNKLQFWDGRAGSLEEQSKGPLINPVEHGLANHGELLKIVRKDPAYVKAFKESFGVAGEKITIDHVAMAIASFERTLVFGNSPFDRYYFGGEKTAVPDDVKKGFEIFNGKGRCQTCHAISEKFALFTDNDFHNIGVGFSKISPKLKEKTQAFKEWKGKGGSLDVEAITNEEVSELGRFAVTLENRHIGAFKTPTLRNVALTAPYMHDGGTATLEEVVEFYDRGGEPNRFLDGGMRPLGLTSEEKRQLVEFLRSLTSPQL
ncbi:MAG: cytochrome-c peroxidase [Nitrospinae bacterium]|nr:cytochrome-c peroxidase [Nitrospinota bacterium]